MICWPAQRGQRESAHARTFARFSIRFSLSFSLSLYYIHKKGKNEERKKNIYTFLASFLDWLCADRNAGVLPPPCLVFSLPLSLRPPPPKKKITEGKNRTADLDTSTERPTNRLALLLWDTLMAGRCLGKRKKPGASFLLLLGKRGEKKSKSQIYLLPTVLPSQPLASHN